MQNYIETFQKFIKFDVIQEVFSKWIFQLISASLTILVFYILWLIVSRVIHKSFKVFKTDITTASFINLTLKYTIFTIGIISALGKIGINTASILASIGIVGLTIGFAARDVLSNLISGLFVFWDRPFVIGDLVEIKGNYGLVKEITLRTTRVVTPDGKMLAVPNSEVVNEIVTSYTNFPNLRLDIDFTIGLEENIGKVRNLLFDMVKDNKEYLDNPAPKLVVTSLNDYNISMQFQIWLKDEKKHVSKRFELREQLYKLLLENKVEMPYETLQINPIEIKGSTN